VITATTLVSAWLAAQTADIVQPRPRRHTLFLNFAGGIISSDPDQAGPTACVPEDLYFPPFLGDGDVAEAAVAEARSILEPYGVTVTAERPPASLEYTEVDIGGLPEVFGLEQLLNGLSCPGIDCGDAQPLDTVFVFSDKYAPTASPILSSNAAERGIAIGRIAVHEAAHAWGLEHSGASDSIMAEFPSAASSQRFVVGCEALDVPLSAACPSEHEEFCGAQQQDAHAELRGLFGLGGDDVEPPTIEIVSPSEGEVFAPGDTVVFEVDARDDRGGVGWSLSAPALAYAWQAPPGVRRRELVVPEGELRIVVTALDHAGNEAMADVTIDVRSPLDPAAGPTADCACRSAPRSADAVPLLLVLAFCGRRRYVL
jgi:hypothetical protein